MKNPCKCIFSPIVVFSDPILLWFTSKEPIFAHLEKKNKSLSFSSWVKFILELRSRFELKSLCNPKKTLPPNFYQEWCSLLLFSHTDTHLHTRWFKAVKTGITVCWWTWGLSVIILFPWKKKWAECLWLMLIAISTPVYHGRCGVGGECVWEEGKWTKGEKKARRTVTVHRGFFYLNSAYISVGF